jgi:WD40 repeat protein
VPERVRVQPRPGEEIVVERIPVDEEGEPYLPSSLVPAGDSAPLHVLSCDDFAQKVREAAASSRPLLVFDQFEELVTLFDGVEGQRSQHCIVEMLSELLRNDLPVKLLFVFRDDYLARIKPLLAAAPELVDQALSLQPPSAEALPRIIRGPFEEHPGHFEPELDAALCDRLETALADRFGSGDVSLSEVQTVCLRLWRSDEPEAELSAKGVQGLLEDYLGEELDRFPEDLRYAAAALLSQMVTSAGTRNVISADDLIARVQEEEKLPRELLEKALDRLEGESKLVRRERRRELDLYEITSEFLVPWISRRRQELIRHREQRRLRRRVVISGAILVPVALLAVVATLGWIRSVDRQREAKANTKVAQAALLLSTDPAKALAQALDAISALGGASEESREQATRLVNRATLASNLVAVLRGSPDGKSPPSVLEAAFAGGNRLATVDASGKIDIWDTKSFGRLRTVPTAGPATTAVFSRNGAILAIRDEGRWTFWRATTGRRLGSLPAGRLTLSPDGRVVAHAVGGPTPGVALFSVTAHGLRGVWFRPFDLRGVRRIPWITFTPDGRRVLAVSQYGGWVIWDVQTGRRVAAIAAPAIKPLRNAPGKVVAATLTPDDVVGVAVNEGQVKLQGRVWVYDGRTGEREHTPWKGVPLSTLGSAGDDRLVLGFEDGSVQIWKPRTSEAAIPIRGHSRPVSSVASSPDAEWVATASDGDSTVKIWDAETGDERERLRGHTDGVTSVLFSPDGRSIVTTSLDGTARVWRTLSTGTEIALPRHDAEVGDVSFSRDGRLVVTASADGTTFLVRPTTGRRVHRFGKAVELTEQFRRFITSALGETPNAVWLGLGPRTVLSADGTRLITGSDATGLVTLWAAHTGRRVRDLRERVFPEAAFLDRGPGGKWAAVPTSRLGVWLLDQRTGHLIGQLGRSDGMSIWPFAAAVNTANGRYLVTGEYRRGQSGSRLRVWDVAARRSLLATPLVAHRTRVVAIDRNGTYVAGGTSTGAVRIWRIRDGRPMPALRPGPEEPVRALAFSPNGELLVTATDGKFADLWKVQSGARLWRLRGHTGAINSTEFSRDGRLVVTASDDGTARVWSVEDGHVLAVFRGGRQGRALDASFSPDASWVVVGASDGSSDVYACPLCGGEQKLLAFARQQAPRVP